MSWGKEWPNTFTIADVQRAKEFLDIMQDAKDDVIKTTGLDLAIGKKLVSTTVVDGIIKHEQISIEKVYQNKVPTHDPYTNPDAHIYYQCACGAVLDPSTKSFAALNNAAMISGWKVRFGHEYYVPYCVKCGEGVE